MATLSIQGGVGTESFNELNFVVTLSAPVADAVSVKYRTWPGTALSGIDFSEEDGTLLFGPGETSKTIGIRMRSDRDVEFDESLIVELFDPTNAEFLRGLPTVRATGWIGDDDNLGNARAMQVSSPLVRETDAGDRSLNFTISLSEAFTTDVEMRYETLDGSAVAGRDYERDSGTVRFFAGQTEAVVTVRVIGDRRIEGPEDFFLAVAPDGALASGAVGAVGRATILDNDSGGRGPVVHVEGGRQTESFNGLPFVVTLSEPSTELVTIKYRALSGTATEGVDFSRTPSFGEGVLTFAPGETSKSVDVRLSSDRVLEVDEAVVLEVYDALNASLGGGRRSIRTTGWALEDDDNLGNKRALFVSSPVVTETAVGDPSFATFDISLSRPSTERITLRYETLSGSARSGSDFTGSAGSVVFEPGQTETSVVVAVRADGRVEPTESFQLRLIPPFPSQIGSSVAGIVGTATIIDSTLLGTSGPDTLVGTAADDVIFARGGDDLIFAGGGDDTIFGESGNDEIDGGRGGDAMTGGSGNDIYIVDSARDRVIEAARQGTDTVKSSVDFTLPAHVEKLTLTGRRAIDGAGNDLANVLRGNSAGNTLNGGRGDDSLFGAGGRDTLIGGLGADRMTGGASADTFVLRSARDSGVGRRADVITDFERRVDEIDLSLIDANAGRSGNQAFAFIGTRDFTKAAGQVRFERELLQMDLDGDGRADLELRLDDVARLSAGDLVL